VVEEEEEEEEEDKEEKGGLKNIRTNSYIAPTSTIVSPFFRYEPTDHGFHFRSIPQNQLRFRIISPYFTGTIYLCMATTYLCFMHHMHVLCAKATWLKTQLN
jgi:hypothetical protein